MSDPVRNIYKGRFVAKEKLVAAEARIKELEAVAEAAVIVCRLVDEKSSMVYGLLERPLRAAGYLNE